MSVCVVQMTNCCSSLWHALPCMRWRRAAANFPSIDGHNCQETIQIFLTTIPPRLYTASDHNLQLQPIVQDRGKGFAWSLTRDESQQPCWVISWVRAVLLSFT